MISSFEGRANEVAGPGPSNRYSWSGALGKVAGEAPSERCVGLLPIGLSDVDRGVSVVPGIENRATGPEDGSRVSGHRLLESVGCHEWALLTSLLDPDDLTQVLGR